MLHRHVPSDYMHSQRNMFMKYVSARSSSELWWFPDGARIIVKSNSRQFMCPISPTNLWYG